MKMDLTEEEVAAVLKIRKKHEDEAVERAKQALCDHPKWEYDGHGHNCDYYKCTTCGQVRRD